MKIEVLGFIISTASRLRKKLLEGKEKGWDKSQPNLYYYVMGVYDSRIFGICIYRTHKSGKL